MKVEDEEFVLSGLLDLKSIDRILEDDPEGKNDSNKMNQKTALLSMAVRTNNLSCSFTS